MSDWALIIYCGIITYLTRFSMIAILKKEMFNDRVREVLSYVPSAIFPAIIFPAIFLDDLGVFQFEDNPKILAAAILLIISFVVNIHVYNSSKKNQPPNKSIMKMATMSGRGLILVVFVAAAIAFN